MKLSVIPPARRRATGKSRRMVLPLAIIQGVVFTVGCSNVKVEIDGLPRGGEGQPAGEINMQVLRGIWLATERYDYVYIVAMESRLTRFWQRMRNGRKAPGFCEVLMRLPVTGVAGEHALPGKVEGYALVSESPVPWGAWRFGDGKFHSEGTISSWVVSLTANLEAVNPEKRMRLGGRPEDDRIVLAATSLEGDPGTPANIFTRRNADLVPALEGWLRDDPGLGCIIVAIGGASGGGGSGAPADPPDE